MSYPDMSVFSTSAYTRKLLPPRVEKFFKLPSCGCEGYVRWKSGHRYFIGLSDELSVGKIRIINAIVFNSFLPAQFLEVMRKEAYLRL
jgi:hypothetical protein